MQNLSQIVTLLQLVLALLSNPQTAQNPQVQALAAQAVQSASDALAVPTTTIPIYNSQAAAGIYTNIGGTSDPVYVAPVSPSCSLTVDYLNSPVSVSWNVENATTFVPNLKWRWTDNGTWRDWVSMSVAPTYVPPHDGSVFTPPQTTETSTVTGLKLLNDSGSTQFVGYIGQTKLYPLQVELTIGGATCDYTITK